VIASCDSIYVITSSQRSFSCICGKEIHFIVVYLFLWMFKWIGKTERELHCLTLSMSSLKSDMLILHLEATTLVCKRVNWFYDIYLCALQWDLSTNMYHVLQPDRFLSDLTSMYERSTEKGSVWVTTMQCECSSQFTGAVLCVIGVVEESKSDLCAYMWLHKPCQAWKAQSDSLLACCWVCSFSNFHLENFVYRLVPGRPYWLTFLISYLLMLDLQNLY
jgi:hypothetical protein